MSEGWVCPRCGRVWAPHVPACDCAAPTAYDTRTSARATAHDDAHGAPDSAKSTAQAVAHGSKASSSKASNPRTPRRNHNYTDHPAFEEFWKVYPSNRDKLRAFNAWLAYVVRANVNPVRVIDAAQAYADDPLRTESNTKYAEGWLSGERWEDELTVRRPATPADSAPVYGTPEWDAQQDAIYERVTREASGA